MHFNLFACELRELICELEVIFLSLIVRRLVSAAEVMVGVVVDYKCLSAEYWSLLGIAGDRLGEVVSDVEHLLRFNHCNEGAPVCFRRGNPWRLKTG